MPASFSHTLRSLERRPRFGLALVPALLLVAAWALWMAHARVAVYVSAPGARIEVNGAPGRVAGESGGRVESLNLVLGADVKEGALLVELDSAVPRAELAELSSVLETTQTKRAGVEQQLSAEREKRKARLRLGELAAQRATIGLEHAEVLASNQEQLARIAEELQREQLNSKVEAVTAEGKLSERRIAVADATAQIERLSAENQFDDKTELARLAELSRQLIDLDAQRIATEAAIHTAQVQLRQHAIYAPISGRLGNVAPLQIGDLLEPGQVVASIVPMEEVRVVAHFPPEPAIGRVLPGQSARLRLDGFSWTEFGMVEARVVRVANEPQDGVIRVELSLSESELVRVPLQHGLLGVLDIQIEETSPWALLERSVAPQLGRERAARYEPAALARQAAR